MATVKLDLVSDIWQEVGGIAFLLDKERKVEIELTNADSLPVGDVAAIRNMKDAIQIFPVPAAGKWYVRSPGMDSSITVTAV